MYQIRNVLNVQNLGDNNRIKQGDKSIIRYALIDANNSPIELVSKNASIRLLCDDNIVYEHNTQVIAQEDIAVVDLVINEVLPAQIYTLEIIVDEKYVFPSDDTAKIEVTKSTLAQVANVLAKPDIVANIKHDVTASLTENVNNYALKLVEQKLEEDKDATRALIDTKIAQIHIPEAKNYDDAVNDLKSEQGTIKQSVQDFLQSLENAKTENANALQVVKTDVQSNKDALSNITKNAQSIEAMQASITLIKQQSDTNTQNIESLGNTYNEAQSALTQGFNNTIEAVNQNITAMQSDVESAKQNAESNNASVASLTELVNSLKSVFGSFKEETSNDLNSIKSEVNDLKQRPTSELEMKEPNSNLLKGTKEYTEPYYNIPTIVKNNVTYAKLIRDDSRKNNNILQTLMLEPNTQYTVSFDTFSDSQTKLNVHVTDSNRDAVSDSYLIAKEDVERKSVTFTTFDDSNYRVAIYADRDETVQAYVAHIKLEKGAIATPYSE